MVDPQRARLEAIRHALITVQAELSLPQVVTLLTVALEPGLSVNELADRLGVPQQSASRYAAVLLGRYQNLITGGAVDALILQEVNPNDPRKRALFLSERGREVVDQFGASHAPASQPSSERAPT